jgi:Protein of unknown function (DUF1592)/Protein of unknown function (DUF1588)/Protein of unknown function (DUF1587)/Protein of unknown function (DUF1585)/Protein of unknown function (DUF1595)/Planctomycete cytochrome C
LEFTPLCRIALVCLAALVAAQTAPAAETPTQASQPHANVPSLFTEVGSEYARDVRPLMARICLNCHSTAKQKGDLDLERFASLKDIRRDTKVWLKVAEMLDNGEMPPKEAKQPTSAERKQLRAWVESYLHAESLAQAGDPGPVVLRRLSNAEYTYTIRDLTGVDLNPARDFPTDGAAGEGFTNAGNALVMSPALLTKYFDAGREMAQHAVLLPDGFRFSPSISRADWTNDVLAQIREIYRKYSDTAGASQVNLQGIIFNTNDGGRLPIEQYLAATFDVADRLGDVRNTSAETNPGATSTALRGRANLLDTRSTPTQSRGRGTQPWDHKSSDIKAAISVVAAKDGLNAKYLGILWDTLTDREPSLLLDEIRAHWRAARPADAPQIAAEIGQWQKAVWRFSSVGHIGKVGGPQAWQEPVTPITASQELRIKLPTAAAGQKDVTLYLVASDAGDGNAHDFAIWHEPRLVAPGRPELALRDVGDFTREMSARREQTFASTARALAAAAEARRATGTIDVAALAKTHNLDVDSLTAWFDYLGIGPSAAIKLDYLSSKVTNGSNFDFIQGWNTNDLPQLLANSSNQHVRVPGNMHPHSVCVHPSPTLFAAVGWRSPIAAAVEISGKVTHSHPECGNGVEWRLELRRGATRQRLAEGIAHGGRIGVIPPGHAVAVQPGDLVSLLVGPRDGNHACDLTDLELNLKTTGPNPREWNLARDVSQNVLAGNPHADRFGNAAVWHFYSEPVKGGEAGAVIPSGSLLARWQSAEMPAEKQQLAIAVQKLLQSGPPAGADKKHPDVALYRQLSSLGGPLFMRAWPRVAAEQRHSGAHAAARAETKYGVNPALFGKHPDGAPIDGRSLCVHAPSVIEVRLPADLAAGTEFVTVGSLDPKAGREGTVQLEVLAKKPEKVSGLLPISVSDQRMNSTWTDNKHRLSESTPIIVSDGSQARRRVEASFEKFRSVFPLALCYTKIVPVDEVVTLTLYYREDDALKRLMLSDAEARHLDRLWTELHFLSRDALKSVDALLQLLEYASQDADPKVFEPMKKPFNERAAAFKKSLLDAEPRHVEALIEFAGRAYRRPLTEGEAGLLRGLYARLRKQGLAHDEAFQLTLARIFVSPDFLYRREMAPSGSEPSRVSDWELASRLSYFLWSSQPDAELRAAASKGTLHNPGVLAKQARRLMADPRVRRLATEFACQWLHVYDFDSLSEKSEKFFPEFTELRGDMYEESIRFFTDFFERDGSVIGLLEADHTFVNDRLAKFYGIPTPANQHGWRRVEGVRPYGRGGILALATTLAKQSGASRTSPILRGNWVSEVLLGEKLPKPPKDVPRLPESETATEGLTVRQLIEKHRSDTRCSTCHRKFDPFGFALENFDAIGRFRNRDLGGRAVDTKTKSPDGTPIDGLAGLREYLAVNRRTAFVHQFCRKLLGYALGRGVQLSDEPLLTEMQQRLAANDYRISAAIQTILESRQFLEIRGRDAQIAESP